MRSSVVAANGSAAAPAKCYFSGWRLFCFSLPYHYLVVAKVVSLSWLLLSRGFSELRSSSQLLPRHIWIANEEEEAASSSSYAKLGPIVTLSNLQWLQVPKSTAAWRQPLLPAKLFPQPFGFHPSISRSKKVSLASTYFFHAELQNLLKISNTFWISLCTIWIW